MQRFIETYGGFRGYDKSTFHLPWHSSFMIMHTLEDWGNTGQNMADGKCNTTDLTTKGARLGA